LFGENSTREEQNLGEFLEELLHYYLSLCFVILPAFLNKVSDLFSIFIEANISIWFHNVILSTFMLFEVTAIEGFS
jgi:hypothetical protein